MSDKTDAEVVASKDDAEYLARPHLWPQQGVPTKCYVKRLPSAQGWRETGPCVLWGTEPLELVIQAHHWDGPLQEAPHALSVVPSNDLVTLVSYTSVADLLADGWIVD